MLSIILLSYFSNHRIEKVYTKLESVLSNNDIPFELIIIDDGSQDNSFEIALKLEQEHDNVKAFQLSKNYTSHYAIFAGLSKASGACATVIPDDEQQPYELLVDMYRMWEKGHWVVIPYRETRDDPFLSRWFSRLFYKTMNTLSLIQFPEGGADTFFIDREIIDILNSRIHPINTTSITEVLRLGYSPYYLPYHRNKGDNKKSRWTLKKKIKLAFDFFFSSSSFPIKLITYTGVFFSLFSFLLAGFYLYIKLFGNNDFWKINVPGWASLIILITFFSGIIIFSLGVVAEYIWRIYEEVKNRPGFIIKNKKNNAE